MTIFDVLVALKVKYQALEVEYVNECAVDFMSRRATYLDGQLATLHEVIQMLETAVESTDEAEVDIDYDEADFDDFDDFDDEIGYDPYTGCGGWDC